MKVEYINPFLSAAYGVIQSVLGEQPTKGEPSLQRSFITSDQVSVVCGVTGQVMGQFIFGMSLATADRIASKMMSSPVKTFDQLAASAIAELANMISGNGLLKLFELGVVGDITPPTVIRGFKVEISTVSINSITVPLYTNCGDINVTIGLQDCPK